MMRKIRFEEMLPHEFDDAIQECPVAYLPLGTLEYHGLHLPLGNDALKAEALCERACRRTGGVLLPSLYWGIGGGHKSYPASIMVRDSLLGELLDDILSGLHRVGLRAIVLLTGHYPGEQVQAVRDAANRACSDHADLRIWALPEYEAYPGERRADHAAKWETSILMALRPELVDLARIAAARGADAPDATRSLEEMNAPGPLHGIMGQNPARYASSELGHETVRVIVDHLVAWVQGVLADLV